MSTTNRVVDISAIESRRREICDEMDRLERELGELDLVLRVIRQFEAKDVVESPSEPGAKLGPPRPEGIPTNYEMAEIALADAVKAGRRGLTAFELVEEIGRRWWPGVQGPQILPMMYQYAKRGRLSKGEDGYFRLPHTNEASPAATGEASNPGARKDDGLI